MPLALLHNVFEFSFQESFNAFEFLSEKKRIQIGGKLVLRLSAISIFLHELNQC